MEPITFKEIKESGLLDAFIALTLGFIFGIVVTLNSKSNVEPITVDKVCIVGVVI